MTANITLSSPAAIVAAVAFPASERALSREAFDQARAAWKLAAKEKRLTAESLAAWAIIRGADPKKGFAPIVNATKLANGARAWGAYEDAMSSCARLGASALGPWEKMLVEQGAVFKGWQWSGEHPILALLRQAKAR